MSGRDAGAAAARLPPARIGDRLDDVDTPALIVEFDALERNVAVMAAAVEGRAVRLRPHAKSHKCPDIAGRQIAAGAVGVCCQKVGEAEIFVAAGVSDVLITNEIVGTAKLLRLAALARHARIGVLVDDRANVQALAAAVQAAGASVDVLVEVDVGAHRCGVLPGAPAPERAIVDAGLKAFAVDSGMPLVAGAPGLALIKASDEHGVVRIPAGDPGPRLGERLKLVPGHCDPTVNLYEWIVAVRNDRVEALWPVAARGALT